MRYTATIDVEHHSDYWHHCLDWPTRATDCVLFPLLGAVLLYGVGESAVGMVVEMIIAPPGTFETLYKFGLMPLIIVGILLLPVAAAICWWSFKLIIQGLVPAEYNPFKRRALSKKGMLGRHTYAFNETEVETTCVHDISHHKWSAISHVIETKHCFYLMLYKCLGGGGLIIPKNGCRGDRDLDGLRSLFSQRIGRVPK